MLYLTIAALVNDVQRSGTLIGATIPHPSQIRRCSWYNALITDETRGECSVGAGKVGVDGTSSYERTRFADCIDVDLLWNISSQLSDVVPLTVATHKCICWRPSHNSS